MRRFGFGFFVGLVILCVGVSIALDTFFAVHLPIVRLTIALLLVALGIRMILGRGGRDETASGEAWMSDRRFAPEGALGRDARYDVVFGRGLVDLTHVDDPTSDVTVTVDAVFGTAVVKVNPRVPYDVVGSSAFGEVRMPDRSAAAFGNIDFRRGVAHEPRLHVKVNAVFGACQVVEAT